MRQRERSRPRLCRSERSRECDRVSRHPYESPIRRPRGSGHIGGTPEGVDHLTDGQAIDCDASTQRPASLCPLAWWIDRFGPATPWWTRLQERSLEPWRRRGASIAEWTNVGLGIEPHRSVRHSYSLARRDSSWVASFRTTRSPPTT